MTSHFANFELRITRSIFAIPLDFEIARLTYSFLVEACHYLKGNVDFDDKQFIKPTI